METNGLVEREGRTVWMPLATDLDLAFFVTWRHGRGVRAGTLRSDISAVAWHYKLHLDRDPTKQEDGTLVPRLKRVLRGIARDQAATRRVRKPITVPLLHEIEDGLTRGQPGERSHDLKALVAALYLGVFLLLRASEFTTKKVNAFRPSVELLRRDVTFALDSQGRPIRADVLIKAAKEDRRRHTQTVELHAVGGDRCPVARLWA